MKPRKIAVCDSETDPFKIGRVPKPFIWGYYDGEVFRHWYDTGEFVQFLKEQDVICYAHNGGKFDWHFLLPHFDPYSEIMLINGRIAKVPFGNAELRDSYNIIPASLAEYKKDDFDYTLMEAEERTKSKNKKKILEYLGNDCRYLHEMVMRFIDDYGMHLTQAGAAMAQWKRISEIEVPITDEGFYQEFSPYYYGGRVQVFQSGVVRSDYHVYDINSAYPYAMLSSHPYSINFSREKGYQKKADFYRLEGVSRGALPYRDKSRAIQFPNDSEARIYTVSHWEYDAAIDTGTLGSHEVLESITFCGHTDFSEYINHFYELRAVCNEKGDKGGSLFCKLLMNSLYGKFAANPDKYNEHMVVPMDVIGALDNVGWNFGGELGPWGLAQKPLEESKKRYYNVATGASITGFVRAMLWRAIHSSKNVLYCDTDSIACSERGEGMIEGGKLGEWKNEGFFNEAYIGGKKLYLFCNSSESCSGDMRDCKKCKGASKGVRLNCEEIRSVASGKEVEYQRDAPTFSTRKAPVFINRKVKMTGV